MRETFYEESAVSARSASEAKLYTLFKAVALVLFVIMAILLLLSFNIVPFLLEISRNSETGEVYTATRILVFVQYIGSIALLFAAGFVFWRLKNRFNLSYDYTFVEDELRVSKVFNGRKRKFLKMFKADQILKMGRCDSDSFQRTCAGLGKKGVRFLTPNKEPVEGKEFFYLLYSTSLEKAVYIVEARVELLDMLVRVAGRNKWESR